MLIVMTTYLRLQASMLESTEAWRPQEWNMTTVDHYAVLPWGPHLYVGYASENKVKLYTRDMRVLEVGGDVIKAMGHGHSHAPFPYLFSSHPCPVTLFEPHCS